MRNRKRLWAMMMTAIVLMIMLPNKGMQAQEIQSTNQEVLDESEEQQTEEMETQSLQEEVLPDVQVDCEIEVESNPIYDFLGETQENVTYDSTERATIPETSGPRLEDFESGIAYLRNAFVNRQEHIEFGFYCDQPIENAGEVIKTALFAHTGNPKEGDYLKFQYRRYSVKRYLISSGSRYCYLLFMDVTYMTDSAEEEVVSTTVDNLIENLGLRTMDTYGKIKTIYDWICQNVSYDHLHVGNTSYLKQFSAYAALIDHTAVCQGYSVLLYRMLLECGIDARVIPGYGNDELHAWNIAAIDGLYYNLDPTWDAGKSTYGCFLRGEDDFIGHVRLADYQTDSFIATYPMAQKTYTEETPEETTPEETASEEPTSKPEPTPEETTPEETTPEETTPQYRHPDGLGVDENGVWKYYKNEAVCEEYTGLSLYYGTWYYVEKGVLNWNYTGLTNYYGTWYYVQQGRLNWNYTGLTQYYGTWYYVQQGRLNWNYTGLTQYYGTWYYVQQGRLNWNYTGLTQYYGTWYYVQKGILNWKYTGLTNYYGTWYYVQKGILNWNYSGTVDHAGIRYVVTNGVAKRQ